MKSAPAASRVRRRRRSPLSRRRNRPNSGATKRAAAARFIVSPAAGEHSRRRFGPSHSPRASQVEPPEES